MLSQKMLLCFSARSVYHYMVGVGSLLRFVSIADGTFIYPVVLFPSCLQLALNQGRSQGGGLRGLEHPLCHAVH